MFDEQDRQYFYNEFKNNGYEVGSYDDFKKDLNNEEDRNWYYNEAKAMGYDVGTQADFDKMVLEPAPSTSSSGGKQVNASKEAKPQVQPSSSNERGLISDILHVKNESLGDAVKDFGSDFVDKLKEVPGKMISTVSGLFGGDSQPQETVQPSVNKNQPQSTVQQDSPESKEAAPVTTPTGVVNNEGLMDAKLANYLENWKQRPDKQSTYFENLVADLLADGTANSNEEAVNMLMPALHRYANRSAMDVTNQVVSSLPDDTVQDAEKSIETQWYSHGVQDKLKQEAYNMGISYDDYVGLFLKPAMVQSLVNKYGPKYRDIAEGIATRLYSHDENVQDRLMNQDINDALSSVISKYVNPSVVDEYNKAQEAGSKAFTEGMEGSQFIPANLRLGTALGAQYEANEAKDPAKVLSSLQKKFSRLYRNPEFLNDMSNAAFKVMQRYGLNGTQSSDPKQFKPMINSVLKNELDQLEIKGMMPKGSAEYIIKTGLGNTIVGKITRKAVQTDYQNWLEDIANQQYQPGFWENVASGALTFAGDAWSYWLPGAAGGKLTKSMVAKAEGKLAGDLMAKGMERRVAERAAKVLIGKSKAAALKSGAAHGAVTFGGQSAISKPIDEIYRTGQFDENGKIYNPSVGKVIANTLGEVAKQSAVGAIMQGGTIANMVGKGRGLATNILADIGGKVVDSGIMTGQQLLERMAHDPSFKPTGKDAAETFLESGANLLSIGFPGFVGKYARFKDAREFNKKFDFSDQDIAELKRFGYDGLRDAFEKMGIGEYAVVGENAQRLDGQLTQKYMDLMNDKSVPEVLKAKMMAVVEGKRPSSFSPVVDSIIVQPMDNGKVYLETLNKDGGVVDRKEYSSLDEAQKADKKLEYEKTLGLASVLEGEFHNEFTQEHLDGLYNKAAQKYNMGEKLTDEDKAAVYLHQNAGAIKEIMDKQQKGIILTDEEQKQVNAYRHYYDSALENSSVMREFVNTFEDSHGVARGTLRKALESKDKKYAPLVESYLKELYNSIELKREMKQIEDDKKRIEQGDVDGAKPATPVKGPASVEGSASGQEPPVSEEPAPYQDRTNSVPTPSDAEVAANPANSAAEGAGNEPKVASSDAFVMGQNAYKNGDSEALQAIDYNSDLATGRLKRAFADNEKMPDIVANAYNEGRDMEQFVAQRASLTPAQKEAISKYVEAMDAKKGAIDALQHADDGYGEALKQQLWPYQTEDGNIVSATLDSGKQVFLKKANEYGGAFVVVPDEQGQPMIKQVSNAEIKEVGTPVSLDEYIENAVAQQKDARSQQFISQFDGSGLKPNDQVTVAMEEGDANINMTFAGYSKDGKIVLTDGKDYLPLSKEEFAAWRKNALDNTINQHLDAEDAKREQEAVSQAEADKKQRYANGIVGLNEGQPDYSSKDTDPNVAAEYLQEQFGEDHGKLLNLVNGSRDDIKTQLANKRKAAIEYQNWLDTNADLDPEKAKKVEDELSLVNEQIADLDARFKNWNTIRNSVMTPDEVKAMKEERKAEVEKAGVDESAIVPSDDFHVLVLEDEELKKQYPTMDKATDYITSQRKDIYHTQEDVERKINGVNDMLDQYINGETELDPTQLMELNTTKAQLEALQTNLSVAAKNLKAQSNKLSRLYKTEVSKKEMEELGMTPSEQRKALVTDALKKNDMKAIHEIYKDASVDVMDLTPQTLEEAVSESLLPHSLNPESLQYELGKSNFKFGIGKGYDSNKFNYLIAKKGTGMSVNEFAVRVYNDLPVNLQDMGYTDQDVRNALLDMFKSYDSVKEMRNVALMNRIAAAEDELSSEEEYYEAQKEREIIERQAEIEKYKSYIHEKELSLPSESELDHINGLEFDRMMEIEDRDREYKQYVKSILPELADYDDRSNEEGYGGGSSLGSDSSRRGVDEGNSQGEEVGNGEASSESEIGEGSDSGRKGRQETGSMEPSEGSAVRGSHLPQEASFGERLKSAIAETETEPTEAQKKAGNYKKGHLSFGGYDYTVETPKGVTRSGKDEQGKPWSVTMHDTYGYILGKIGVDGDHIDMFINDAADLDTFDGNVYVVDQVNPETGEFDEHKVMYGYPSEEAATEAYLANYSKGWKGLGKVTSVPKTTFDRWLESSDHKTKPFAEYAMVQKEQRAAYEKEMMQDGAHSEAFDKIVDLAKEQKEYWDLMEQGEVDPNDVPEVDVAHKMDELLKTLSDEEFKEVSDVLQNIDEEFEYFTADEYERREDLAERKNAAAYSEFLKQETKSIAPFADALRNAVNSGDNKAIAKAQKELTDALLASNLGHGYLSGQLEYAKSAKKKDESYSERRAFIKPLTDAINAIESALDSALADVGLEGVHVDFKEYGYCWIYADKGSDWRDRLEPLDNDYRNVSQYSDVNPISVLPQITMNNVKKVAGIIKSRIEEGERYNSDENQDENIEEAKKTKDNLPFHRDVKEVKPLEMTEAQKVAYDAVSTMLKKAGIPVKVVSNEDMEKVAEAQDNLNLAMLLNQPEMRFKIKTPEEKQAAENAYNFAKELRPDKWKQYAVVDMSNPNKMPEYFEKQELARKERSYYNKLMWGNYKVFNLDKSFEDNVAGLTGSFPSEFDPYKIDAQTSKKNELKKQMKETEEAYKLTGQERKEYQNQLMKEYMDEHGLASENDIPDDVWREFDYKAVEKYQDKLDSLFAKYKDLDRQLKAVAEPGVRFLRTYHGSQASFDKFDHSFMGSGEGAQAYGWGTYVSEVEGIAKAYAKQNAKKNAPSNLMYQGKPMTYKTPSIIYQVAFNMDKFNISAKEAISKMIDAVEKKLASVSDTPFAKMKAKQDKDELKVLKGLNPSDFKINDDYDTVAQNLTDTKSGLDLLEDELKDAKSYVDLYQSRLDEAKEELSKAKESGTGLGVDMYESDVMYYSEQVEKYKQNVKTKESDIKDVKTKIDALQKKLDSMEKPRNLYSVDIPDDTGDNYIGWDDPLNAKQIGMWKKALLSVVPESDRAYYEEWADGMLDNRKKENNPLTGKDAYYAIDSKYASKKTSMALSKAGFVGVKVIAQRNAGGNKDGKMNYVIFDENNAQIVDHTKFAQGKGVVYGYTDGKEIVLNQEHLNANTPIHEYQHLWRTAAKKMNPELIEHGDKLIMQTQLFADLKEDPNYKHLSDDEICDEAFARLTGEDGAAILEQMANDAIKENPLDTAKELTIINRLKNWLKKFWYWTLDTFTKWKPEDIKKMTLEDIRNLVLRDLAQGVDPRTVLNEKKAKKDDKTLAGVHNITEEKLRKALKLGGLANPSLAVIDTNKSAHDNFGEISFIAPSALVDKRTGKTAGTWITDAYTQRYPSVERQMSEKGYRKFEDWVDSLDYPSGAKAEIKRQTKDVLEDNGVPAWELMYLKEKGIDIKAYDSNVDYRWKEIINKYPTAEDILNNMKNDAELNEEVTSLAKYEIVKPTRDKISLEVRRQIYKETGVKTSPISPKVRKKVNEIFDRDYKSTLLGKDGKPKAEDVKKVVEQMVKEHNDTKKYDFYLSKVKASNYVHKNGLYADYIRWQENKLDDFGTKNRIFRGYKNDGSRKYVPETLENVSKAMREEANGQTNGGEYTSFGSFIAKLASRVDSTSEMRANKEKLSSNKDKEEFYEKWQDVYYDLAKTLYNDVFYGEQRLHDIVSQPDPKKYAKKEYGITLTPSFMKKLDSLKNAVQNDLKSAYFETKFNRPVHLNEFVAAVVPNNLGEDVRKELEESGLSLYDYDPEKEGDRKRAFNEAINSNNEIRFHRVTEPEELERLNKEKTFRMYSGMQEVDGKLYSPMAAIIDGKRTDATEIGAWMGADERPDLVKNGKFQLVKTDKNPGAGEGPVRAAYNPYMHTSTSMMNDQFTGAYARGNIKVVEWEIPESEKTSGYRAEGAKDAVGLVPWHSGSVNGLLPKDRQRSVMLSRWRKAVRVVPDSEVAESIAEQLDGTGLAIPWNVVTPNQLRELVKLGVPITTDESGQQAPETKEKFMAQMEELKKEFPQAQFVNVKMTKDAFKEWGVKNNVKLSLGDTVPFVREQRSINNAFNDALDKQIAGTLPKGYNYQLGKPSSALKFAGIEDLPIELSSRTLEVKSSKDYKSNHPFDLNSVKNLPVAIQRPVAIFDSEYEDGRKVILTELKDGKGHSFIAVLGLRKLRGRNYAEVNSIISLYGKDSSVRIANWFDSKNPNGLGLDKNLCRWADTKKASEWLTNNASNVHSVGLSLKRIAKVINSFENNQFSEENLLLKHNFGDILGNSEGIAIENMRKVADSVVNTANKLGGAEATVYSSLDDVPEEYRSEVEQGAKGWYDPETHTVHVYLPNCADANEAERTVLHEKIGHEGMEVLLGGENEVRKFANFVYRSASKDVRGKIIDFANKYDPDWKNNDRMNVGTQEYIAHLAEEGPKTAEDFSLWTKIKHYLIKVLKKLGVRVPGLLNDKDLRYYLMKAGKALHVWDEMPQEKQEALMKQASNAEIKDALSDGTGKGKPRQKKGESAIQYMKRVMEWKRWKEAREDENDPEPPMFYDFDKDAEGKKEWERLNKEWRDSHHLQGDEMPIKPERKEGETDEAFFSRYKEWEKWNDAMADKENPMPDMFSFEKAKQDEARQKYEDWLTRHELNEQNDADLDLYEGKIYPAETNPEADALEQRVMQDLAEVTSTDVSKEGAAMTVKHAVIHRRKNMEEASADDAIYINDVKNRIEKMAGSGVYDKLLSDYKGKKNRAEKLAETIPYIIEAPRRLRDMAHNLNATGVFDKGHIHIQPADVEAIQPYVTDLITETAKKHTVIRKGKEIEVYDDPKAVSEVASKMAQAINANHQGEEGFVPIDGTDILSKHVLKLVKERVVPGRINYKELSPEMQSAIDSIRDWYNYTYDWLMDNHTLKAGTGYNVDYVNHIWDKEKSDPEAYATFVENRQRTKSPNEKPRTISTLMEGIYAGLVPKTTDITKMMAYYSRSNIEAWANKTMLQELTGLNVIERNEKGDVISSDPLLSSSAPFNLEQYKYFEIPGVGPVWVYNVSPKQVKVKNPITDNEKVIYSEASAGDRFGVVFETYQSSPFWKTFDTLASSAKKLELGFSGFHAGALTEVYMVQNMVEFGPKKAMANFMKYIFVDTMKNHELPCFANPEDFQEAATHLVKFGATNDYAAADVQNMFDNMRDAMMKVQEKLKDGNGISGTVAKASMPLKVATQMLSLINKGMDVALWDFLHDGLKLATYRMRADKTKERAKKKGWTEEELSRALDEDGQFVNDMFGGQHWDVLGASHRTLRYAGRVLLSPDWNASTTRHFLALTGFGSIWNEATFENFKQYYKRLKHKELTPEDEGRRSRQISALLCYGIGFMVFYEGIANGINAAFRALDEEKERKKADEIRKTNPSYKSMYELAYGDEGMKWYDYLMRGNSLGQQSKIFMGRYADGTEMYIRHGKQFREVPEYLFNHKGELEFPGPMVQRMIGKANPMVRMTLDDINYLSDFQASHADQEIQRKYGKTIGLLYKDALYWAPFLIPSQENKEFKAVDFFFPSSKGFSPWKAQSYFKDFILSGDMEGVVMTYQSCQRNGIDPEAQIKAAIGSVKALESAEMSDGVTSLQEASKRFDAAKSITEKKKMRQKMKKFLSQSEYKAFTQKEALDMVQGYLNGDEDLKEMEKAESKYLMKAKAEDVTEDWRIQNVWNGTIETYQEYQRLQDVDKAKANAFKNSKTNKRLFAARKAISAARRKMNKAKKQMDGTNDAAKLVEIRNTRKNLLKTLNGME